MNTRVDKIKVRCLRCGYEWTPRKKVIVVCARCRSPYFNTPRRKKKGENNGWNNRTVRSLQEGILCASFSGKEKDSKVWFPRMRQEVWTNKKANQETKSMIGSKNPNWKGGKVKRICLSWGKKFEVFPVTVRSGGGKYCSSKCRTERIG